MAITFEKTPLEWKNSGTEPSTDLKENGFSAGYRPAASTFNYQINNTSECLTELQTKLSDLDQDAIKGIKGNGTTINPSSTGVINITPNNIGAAASTHYHNASQITSGVLPIERGGTGATTLEEARGVLSGGTILYSNESGTTAETITLSDDISNYKYVEIYYKKTIDYTATNTSDIYTKYNISPPILELAYNVSYIGVVKTIVNGNGTTNISIEPCHYFSNKTFNDSGRNKPTGSSEYLNYYKLYYETRIEKHIIPMSLIGNTCECNVVYFIETVNRSGTTGYCHYDSETEIRHYSANDISPTLTQSVDTTVGVSGLMSIYAIVGYK